MKITRDNYESFFLDYLEGNLEESLIDQFLDFLEQHPDLKEELQLFETIHLPEEPISFSGKKQLYKTPANEKETFELKAVALMEGDLKEEDRRLFETYLDKHPKLKKEAALFEKTRLLADQNIQYPEKRKLYKTSGTVILMKWLGRAAAVAILLLGINIFFQSEQKNTPRIHTEELASVKKPTVPSTEIKSIGTDGEEKTKVKEKAKAEAKSREYPGGQAAGLQNKPTTSSAPSPEPEMLEIEEITPLMARLESESVEGQLAVSRTVNSDRSNNPRPVKTVDQYLAQRAKKVTNEGLLSANRILRVGLNVASELSGERIGYTLRDGKVASLDFDSKLLAFSIPLSQVKP